MAKLMVDVTKGSLISAYVIAPFDQAKQALESQSFRVISLEELVGLRIQEGRDSSISRNSSITRENLVCIPGKGVFLPRYSPILNNAQQATDCHKEIKKGKVYVKKAHKFYLTDEQAEKSLAESVQVRAVEIQQGLLKVPTNRLADDEKTIFLFKKYAREYGELLMEQGITEMHIWLPIEDYVNLQARPFARQIEFRGISVLSEPLNLKSESSISGAYLQLAVPYFMLRGVKELKEIGFSRLEK